MPIERHIEQSWTQENLQSINADPERWFERARALRKSAEVVRTALPQPPPDATWTSKLAESERTGTDLGLVHVDYMNLHGVAGMLFAMYLECAFKGIWLMNTPKKGRPTLSSGKNFKVHNLKSLSVQAKLKITNEEFNDDLDLFRSLIVGIGRFAGPTNVEDLIPFGDQAVDQKRWDRWDIVVCQREPSLSL